MKRMVSCLLLVFCLGSLLFASASAAAEVNLSDLQLSPMLAVCSISQEKVLRAGGYTAALGDLGGDEFYSYYLKLRYTGSRTLNVSSLYVRVDGGDKWGWNVTSLEPGASYSLHVYYSNMKRLMKEGAHTAVWYINNEAVCTQSFMLTEDMNWANVFSMPSAQAIATANQTATVRSPYLYGWLDIGRDCRFTEYAIDVRADYLPKATYCCLANMKMDLSALKKQYKTVRTEYEDLTMYAGLQRRWNEYVGILSFWDVYCTDKSGNQTTIRAKRLYPEKVTIGNGTFTGEGDGAQSLVTYDWKPDNWYRMLLQCSQSAATGTTLVEQWICDLETGEWTFLCRFDTGLPDSYFVGNSAFFLENFDPDYAGDVRTMEVANARVRDAKTGRWRSVSSAYIGSNGGLPSYEGSYAYGASGSRFWMITSGAGGDWYGTSKAPKNNRTYSVKNGADNSPY